MRALLTVLAAGLAATVANAQVTADPTPPAPADKSEMNREIAMGAMGVHADRTYAFTLIEELDITRFEGNAVVNWEAQGWVGGDVNKFWWRTEGETKGPRLEQAEFQALYSRNIATFFDVQGGIRYDLQPDRRAYAVLALTGLAPGFFETEVSAFFGFKGDVSLRTRASFDLRMTNRLIIQPNFELDTYANSVPERLIAPGPAIVEAGVFTRYEITRKFAPYVAVTYERRLGRSAQLAREAGEGIGGWFLRGGVRLWF